MSATLSEQLCLAPNRNAPHTGPPAVTYYSCIIAWAAYFFGASFKWPFPWAVEDCAGFESDPERTACATDPKRALPLPRSDSYFEDTVLNTSRAALEAGVARTISGPLYGSAHRRPPL